MASQDAEGFHDEVPGDHFSPTRHAIAPVSDSLPVPEPTVARARGWCAGSGARLRLPQVASRKIRLTLRWKPMFAQPG